jgi:AcrR family transcriptional regulator
VPRAGLTPDRVVAEAAEVLDAVGVERLTLTAIAERVGVAVPSLYKHVGGLDDLHRRLASRSVHELGEVLSAATRGRTGPDALHALADRYRTWALAHPGRYAATVRAPDPADAEHTAASEAVLATLSRVLEGYDLTGEDAIHAIRTIRSALHGFVTLEASGGFGLPHDVDRSFHLLVDALDQALTRG